MFSSVIAGFLYMNQLPVVFVFIFMATKILLTACVSDIILPPYTHWLTDPCSSLSTRTMKDKLHSTYIAQS
jgi:hypothetical protein